MTICLDTPVIALRGHFFDNATLTQSKDRLDKTRPVSSVRQNRHGSHHIPAPASLDFRLLCLASRQAACLPLFSLTSSRPTQRVVVDWYLMGLPIVTSGLKLSIFLQGISSKYSTKLAGTSTGKSLRNTEALSEYKGFSGYAVFRFLFQR